MQRSTKTIPGSAVKPTKVALKRQAEVFKALGHPGRMAIVHALGGGEVCACELATVAGCAPSTKEIMAFGVMMTPALAVNGKVKVAGRVPSAEEIKKLLV